MDGVVCDMSVCSPVLGWSVVRVVRADGQCGHCGQAVKLWLKHQGIVGLVQYSNN